MENLNEHEVNHYHALVLELQQAKKEEHIYSLQFLEHDIRVFMNIKTPDAKIQQVADHISKKYRVYTTVGLTSKTITIHEAYTLDPKV